MTKRGDPPAMQRLASWPRFGPTCRQRSPCAGRPTLCTVVRETAAPCSGNLVVVPCTQIQQPMEPGGANIMMMFTPLLTRARAPVSLTPTRGGRRVHCVRGQATLFGERELKLLPAPGEVLARVRARASGAHTYPARERRRPPTRPQLSSGPAPPPTGWGRSPFPSAQSTFW
eukprot:scaffold1621_cov350-Prasinococcus_capsulatus_cf.AAC.5